MFLSFIYTRNKNRSDWNKIPTYPSTITILCFVVRQDRTKPLTCTQPLMARVYYSGLHLCFPSCLSLVCLTGLVVRADNQVEAHRSALIIPHLNGLSLFLIGESRGQGLLPKGLPQLGETRQHHAPSQTTGGQCHFRKRELNTSGILLCNS